ncbi:hypothetical protein [Streptomyces flaveolus]|uniref:hypothetical protein n=1 Tax=Streptomyces flaveolus TaxID=67297 RepID=UPI00340D723B
MHGVQNPVGDAGPAQHDHVGAEGADQCLVRRRSVGDHGDALGPRHLHHVSADHPRSAYDGEYPAGGHVGQVESQAGSETVHG